MDLVVQVKDAVPLRGKDKLKIKNI